jgi:biopolymer transport protein ExbB
MNTQFQWSQATTESPIFWLLVICSVITLGVALERAAYYWRRRGNTESMMARVVQCLRTGDSAQAVWACRAIGHPLGRTALETLDSIEDPDLVAEERLFVTLSEEKLLLERNLAILGTMAAAAPLIGLLGTVWGIMRAFHDMSVAGSAAPTIVAAGVAEALTTTAAGLVVAVPALLLYNHFARKMNVMLIVAENQARGLRALLNRQAAGRPATGAVRTA